MSFLELHGVCSVEPSLGCSCILAHCFLPAVLAFAWRAPEDGGAGHTGLNRTASPFQLVLVTLKTTLRPGLGRCWQDELVLHCC